MLLFLIAFPLLFWNEGRAVKRAKTLKEGGGAVISVSVDAVNPANEGKLVHVTGTASTDAVLTDPVFPVSATALKLQRQVRMYQWQESSSSKTRKKLGGGTETVKTYTYKQVWSDKLINSANFKQPSGHQNPGYMAYESNEQLAREINLGAFILSPALTGKISTYEDLPIPGDFVLPDSLRDKAAVHGQELYIGTDPASPRVGDMRVSFRVVKPLTVSVIAQQTGKSFEAYSAKAGGTIELLQTGTHSADAMIKQAQASNRMLTWVLRVVGFVLMLIGLSMIFKPLSVVADVLPIAGTIVGAGTFIIAFLLAAGLSLVTIAIAWVFYRPLLGIGLLIVAVALAVLVIRKLLKAKKK